MVRIVFPPLSPSRPPAAPPVPDPTRRHRGGRRKEAEAFLLRILLRGPQRVGQVMAEGERLGLAARTIRRAGRGLGVRSRRSRFGGPVTWSWPD